MAAAVAVILILGMPTARACSWASGYFYQVTNLKGKVVGINVAPFHSVRWLRQASAQQHVKLTLYEYRWPRSVSDLVSVKSAVTDTNGQFDFGALRPGHYTLIVEGEKWTSSDWFDVEVKSPPNPKESVTIDISPVSPDCTGGHEFIVNAN